MQNLSEIELITSAKEAFNRSDYKKAQMIFSEIIDNNNENAEAFFYLANIFHMNGEIGKAIKAFNRVLTLDPGHTDASISLSVLYNDIGKYEDAKRVFEVANERIKKRSNESGFEDKHINKKFALKHAEIADLYMSYDRYDEALFEYNKAIALNPENLDQRVRVSKVYAKKGYITKSIEELKKLKNENPEYLPARIALGILYYGNSNIIEAQSEWEKVLAMDSSNSEAAMYLNIARTATETSILNG